MTEAVTFRYDVFLSYSHRDQEWVRSELLPQQVCIDFRDFEAGPADALPPYNTVSRLPASTAHGPTAYP